MDFTKFVAMLATRSLHFTRGDRLGDPFEGSLTHAIRRVKPSLHDFTVFGETSKLSDEQRAKLAEAMDRGRPMDRLVVGVNSWHMSDHESAAMWQVYLKSDEGIAIQATYQRLKDSFQDSPQDVMIGVVQYINYQTMAFPRGNALHAFVHKRKSFEYEQELRALVYAPKNQHGVSDFVPEAGIDVGVDLSTLLENVYVAPTAPTWFVTTVAETMRRFGVDNVEPQHSSLDEDPVW